MSTLILDADFRVHAVVGWQEAICLIHLQKALVLHYYEDWVVRSPSTTLHVPAVLLLKRYIGYKKPIPFTRPNVYARDNYTCQYCGASVKSRTLTLKDLTFDHVYPRSRGGLTSWDNIVTSCGPCNRKKANKTPGEAGMPLKQEPRRPPSSEIEYIIQKRGDNVPEPWKFYLRKQENRTSALCLQYRSQVLS